MTGRKPQELINPAEFPAVFFEVWESFQRLSARRSNNGMGLNPITYLDIDAFCRVTKTHLTDFEISIIERLDMLLLNSINRIKK